MEPLEQGSRERLVIFSVFHIADSAAQITGSTAMFNHAGDGVILTHHSEHTLRVIDYPSLTVRESPAAHVGGCVAVALDPRGRLASFSLAQSNIYIGDTADILLPADMTPSSTCLTFQNGYVRVRSLHASKFVKSSLCSVMNNLVGML
jgi:hypothetical protein